jgi:hypothetical protein
VEQLRKEVDSRITVRDLDLYLWIIGQYREQVHGDASRLVETIERARQPRYKDRYKDNEIIQLFGNPTQEQRSLLNRLTDNDFEKRYQEALSSGLPPNGVPSAVGNPSAKKPIVS